MSLHVPWIQVTNETWGLAGELASLTDITFEQAFTGLCEAWRWSLTLGSKDEPPMGVLESPLAMDRLAARMRFKGDRQRLAEVLVELGIIELNPNGKPGLRIRGTRRYWGGWKKNNPDKWKEWASLHPEQAQEFEDEQKGPDKPPRGNRTEPNRDRNGAEPEPNRRRTGEVTAQPPQTQTQTQIQTQVLQPPPPTPSAPNLALVPPADEVVVEKDEWSREELSTADGWLKWKAWRRKRLRLPAERSAEDVRERIAELLRQVLYPERLCAAYDAYVRDKKLNAAADGWPIRVFLSEAIYFGRLPPIEAYA